MARYLGLGNERIHYAAKVAFPRVRCPSQQGAASALQQTCLLQSGQRSDDRRGVARHDAGRITSDRTGEGAFGDKGMACDRMLFAAMDNELDAARFVTLDVCCGDVLRSAIDNDVGFVRR